MTPSTEPRRLLVVVLVAAVSFIVRPLISDEAFLFDDAATVLVMKFNLVLFLFASFTKLYSKVFSLFPLLSNFSTFSSRFFHSLFICTQIISIVFFCFCTCLSDKGFFFVLLIFLISSPDENFHLKIRIFFRGYVKNVLM